MLQLHMGMNSKEEGGGRGVGARTWEVIMTKEGLPSFDPPPKYRARVWRITPVAYQIDEWVV